MTEDRSVIDRQEEGCRVENEKNLLESITKGRNRPSHVLLSFGAERLRRLPPLHGRCGRNGPRSGMFHTAHRRDDGEHEHGGNQKNAEDHRRAPPREPQRKLPYLPKEHNLSAPGPGAPPRHYEGAVQEARPWTSRLDDSSPSLVRDPNKCVLCGDCVRICSEVQSVGAIDFAYRGAQTMVIPSFGKDLDKVECVNCGQCARICPTGALTPKSEVEEVWKALHEPGKSSRGPGRPCRARGGRRNVRSRARGDHNGPDRRGFARHRLRQGVRYVFYRRPDGHRREQRVYQTGRGG